MVFKKEDKEKKNIIFWILGILAFAFIFIGSIDMISAQEFYKTGENLNVTVSCAYLNCSESINATLLNSDREIIKDNIATTIRNGYVLFLTNLTTAGDYSAYLSGATSNYLYLFTANEEGIELTEGRSLLSMGLLAILVLFMFISLFYLYQIEDYRGKFVLYWVSHVLFMLITFAGWQIGVEGLLGGMALTGIFRIMFWIMAVASFPLIIGSLAWIFYTHTMGDDVRNMVDKGMGVEEAFRRSAKKRYF